MKKILKEWKKFLTEAPVIYGSSPDEDDERIKIIGKAMDLVPTVLARIQPEWYELLYQKAISFSGMGSARYSKSERAVSYGTAVVDSAIRKFKYDHLFAQPNDRQSLFNWYDKDSGRWYDGGGGSTYSSLQYDIHDSVERSTAWKNWIESQQPWKQFFSDSLDGTMEARLKEQGVPGDIVGKLFSSPENFLDIARLVNEMLNYNLGDIG